MVFPEIRKSGYPEIRPSGISADPRAGDGFRSLLKFCGSSPGIDARLNMSNISLDLRESDGFRAPLLIFSGSWRGFGYRQWFSELRCMRRLIEAKRGWMANTCCWRLL